MASTQRPRCIRPTRRQVRRRRMQRLTPRCVPHVAIERRHADQRHPMKPPHGLTATLFLCMLASWQVPCLAQQPWPAPGKLITYVVPYPAGGTTDILGRMLAQKLGTALGTTVIVDNKPGATGTIGTAFVSRAAPDGYTLLGTSIGPQAIVPSLNPKLPYDPVKSLEPVTLVGTVPHALVVAAGSPFKTVKELVAAAQAKPGELAFASGGNSTILQMQGELLKIQLGIDITHVPYKGDTPAIQDVLGGQVTLMFAPVAAALPHIQSGKLHPLAVTSATRLKSLRDVPTMAEAGGGDFVAEQWQGGYLPANTPKPIVRRLNAEIVRILNEADVAERVEKLGVSPVGSSPGQLAE